MGRTDRDIEEMSQLEAVLRDIIALGGQPYRQLLAFLQALRNRKDAIDFAEEVSAFLEGKPYPQALQAVLRKIQSASQLEHVRNFGAGNNNLALEWLLWARTLHEGCNIRNPQETPGTPSTFPLDRRLRVWIEGTHKGQHFRGDPLEVRHYADFSRLHYQGKKFTIPADGKLMVIGKPYVHCTLFGHTLGSVLTVPDISLGYPYSRIGLQARRHKDGFSFYDNGSWLPVRYDDGRDAGRFESLIVEDRHDHTCSVGHSEACPSMGGGAKTMADDGGIDMPPELSAPLELPPVVRMRGLPDELEPKKEPVVQQERRNVWQKIRNFFRRKN